MKRSMKILAIVVLIGAAGAASQDLFANCTPEGPYELRQCSKGAWFGVKPAGAGAHSVKWWGVGFGNANANSTVAEVLGNGGTFPSTGTTLGVHFGIDSGTLTAVGLDLVDASNAGIGAPQNTLCFSASANWGTPGLDSCIDVNRNDTDGNGTAAASDNSVNRYWDTLVPPGYLDPDGNPLPDDYNHQLDPPMGVLLTESTGSFFAAAFFASLPKTTPRNENPDPGQYSLGEIRNGDTGPQGPNIVPWQAVPQPSVAAVLSVPTDPLSPRNLTFDWPSPAVIHDNSVRPCFMIDGTTPCTSLGAATGVGVMDQGPLMHFEVEIVAMDLSGNCLATWAPVAGSFFDLPTATVPGTPLQRVVNGIAPDTCVRLKTSFGRTPTQAMRTCVGCTSAQITAARNANRLDSQRGNLGDLGYSVVSVPTKVGGTLVSQKATLKFASREKGALRVAFDTDTELNVTSFEVVGIDGKGGRKVLGTVACSQCTTGLSASYDELISGARLQGAKKVQIVMQPSGGQSNTLDLR